MLFFMFLQIIKLLVCQIYQKKLLVLNFLLFVLGKDFKLFFRSSDFTYEQHCSVYYNQYKTDCIFVGIVPYYYIFNVDSDTSWRKLSSSASLHVAGILEPSQGYWYDFIYTNHEIKDTYGNIVFNKSKNNAFIENKEQIETGKFDKVIVNAADYTNKELYLLTYWFTENTDNLFETMLPRKIISLKTLNNFYVGTKNEKAIYEVPFGHTGIDLVER